MRTGWEIRVAQHALSPRVKHNELGWYISHVQLSLTYIVSLESFQTNLKRRRIIIVVLELNLNPLFF